MQEIIPDPMFPITDAVADLGVYLAMWESRDVATQQATAVRTGQSAVEAIDAAMRNLGRLRSRLVAEVEQCEGAGAARVDAGLAANEARS